MACEKDKIEQLGNQNIEKFMKSLKNIFFLIAVVYKTNLEENQM